MSTAAMPTTQSVPAILTGSGNKFDFSSRGGHIKVTYYPRAPGPPEAGKTPGSSLAYNGPEGEMAFSGSEIATQDTPMGTMLSVVLGPLNSVESKTFSLFLPPVGVEGKSQKFTTYAITTEERKSPISLTGTPLSYTVERLEGDAQIVIIDF